MPLEITFTNTSGIDLSLYEPQPARLVIPDWYKNTESYLSEKKAPLGDGQTSATIKRCMPVFDAITAGYILTTYVDVYVSQKDGISISKSTGRKKKIKVPWYEWPSYGPIQFHPIEQAPEHPLANGFSYPKWINPWSIRTPENWSILFMPPMHRENQPFQILPGIVDTDKYFSPTNFPFVLNDVTFEGLIPAGTPMAQVIPIRRDSWEVKVGGPDEIKDQVAISQQLRSSFFDSYKRKFRQDRNYS